MDNFRHIIKPDLTHNSKYPFCPVEQIYNTLLLDSTIDCPLLESNKITLINKRDKSKLYQTIVFDTGNIVIGQRHHKFYYLAPGLKISNAIVSSNNYILNINDKEYPLSLFMKPTGHKLIIGSLILSDNFYANFNIGDNIQLYTDGTITEGKLKNKKNRLNYYSGNKVNTILDIMREDNIDILYVLNNNNMYDKVLARSLDCTILKDKGSIKLVCDNSINKQYIVKCSGVDNSYLSEYNMKSSLIIPNLSVGSYTISISDTDTNIVKELILYVPPFIENHKTRSSLPKMQKSNNLIQS